VPGRRDSELDHGYPIDVLAHDRIGLLCEWELREISGQPSGTHVWQTAACHGQRCRTCCIDAIASREKLWSV